MTIYGLPVLALFFPFTPFSWLPKQEQNYSSLRLLLHDHHSSFWVGQQATSTSFGHRVWQHTLLSQSKNLWKWKEGQWGAHSKTFFFSTHPFFNQTLFGLKLGNATLFSGLRLLLMLWSFLREILLHRILTKFRFKIFFSNKLSIKSEVFDLIELS